MSDERDEARLKMRAEANFERNLRYKDSRLRTIGLPTQALAQQVAEKKFAKQREIDEGKAERARNADIDAILEKVATDEEFLRRQKAAQMREEWNAQIQEKEFLRKKGRQSEIDSFKNDTPMEFAGDDPLHIDRVAQQREQIRRWTEEDLADREWRKQREREEDMAQAQLNLTIDEMRLQQQMEEDRLKKEVTRKILMENNEVSVRCLYICRWSSVQCSAVQCLVTLNVLGILSVCVLTITRSCSLLLMHTVGSSQSTAARGGISPQCT